MKYLTLIAALALSSCASVRIDLVISEYTPPTQYCWDGLQGEVSKSLSSVNSKALITRDGMIYYAPNDEIRECD